MDTAIGESEATQTICPPNNWVVPIAAQPHLRIFFQDAGAGAGWSRGWAFQFLRNAWFDVRPPRARQCGASLLCFERFLSIGNLRPPKRVLCSQMDRAKPTILPRRLKRRRTDLRIVSPHVQIPFARRSNGDHLDVWVREFRICLIVLRSYIHINHHC